MKIVKRLLKEADDPFTALLSYRATPLPWAGRSPAELLMGRNIPTTIPQAEETLIPQWSYLKDFRRTNDKFKRAQKKHYDRRHRVCELPDLPNDTAVWITTDGNATAGRVVRPAGTPRSYVVQTPGGEMRRTRSQLNTRSRL